MNKINSFYKKNDKLVEALLVILAGLLASFPLLLKGIDGAAHQDLAFHLSRIEGLKEGLLAGKFPVMMESVWLSGKGYPVAIFYGDMTLYFPAILRIIRVPVIASYKIYILVINLLTSFAAYKAFKAIFKNGLGAALGAMIYITAAYRMVDIYVRNAAGEYTAFLFFPIIAYGIYRILFEESEGRKEILLEATVLALGMTGLMETHLLSLVMTVFLLVIFCLLYAKKTFRKRSLCCIVLAAVETLILNLYYLVPFMDYYLHEPVYAGTGGDHSYAMQIRQYGASLGQLFSFFARLFGVNSYDPVDRMQLTVGLPAMLVIISCFVIFVIWQRKYSNFVLGFMAVLCIWMSTSLFPWNTLEGYTHLFKFLSNVQFPWRYLAPAIFFIAILFCNVFSSLSMGMEKTFAGVTSTAAVIFCIVMPIVFTCQYKAGYYPVNFKNYDEVNSGYIGACEYLKNNIELDKLDYIPENDVFEECELVLSKDNTVIYRVKNGSEVHKLEVNKHNYSGYVAIDDNKNHLNIEDGYNDLITVTVPAGYEGNIKVTFKQPGSWIFAELISLLFAVTLLALYIRSNRKEKA